MRGEVCVWQIQAIRANRKSAECTRIPAMHWIYFCVHPRNDGFVTSAPATSYRHRKLLPSAHA